MTVSAVRHLNAREKSITFPLRATSRRVSRNWSSLARSRCLSTLRMVALEKKGFKNSLRFLASGRLSRDWREPVRNGLLCQSLSNGVPTLNILQEVKCRKWGRIWLITGYKILSRQHAVHWAGCARWDLSFCKNNPRLHYLNQNSVRTVVSVKLW